VPAPIVAEVSDTRTRASNSSSGLSGAPLSWRRSSAPRKGPAITRRDERSMRVKARAVILIDGRLIVAEQRRRGRTEHSLPGGRVNERESVLAALKREVAEETGLDVTPGQLVYVSEIVESVRRHDLELIFLAEPFGVPGLNAFKAIDVQGGERLAMNPPILEEIARDLASGWRETPRWLGNLARSLHPPLGTDGR
jgi:ADP-ribose pyrophosphatase YjhB (NUDIX family)